MANRYTPVDKCAIPTGELAAVDGHRWTFVRCARLGRVSAKSQDSPIRPTIRRFHRPDGLPASATHRPRIDFRSNHCHLIRRQMWPIWHISQSTYGLMTHSGVRKCPAVFMAKFKKNGGGFRYSRHHYRNVFGFKDTSGESRRSMRSRLSLRTPGSQGNSPCSSRLDWPSIQVAEPISLSEAPQTYYKRTAELEQIFR